MRRDSPLDSLHLTTVPAAPDAGRAKLYSPGLGYQTHILGNAVGPRGIGTRWGWTSQFHFSDSTDIVVTFEDGYPPRVGDLVVSINGLSWGDVHPITGVYPSGNADIGLSVFNIHSWADSGWINMTSFGNGWIQYPGWEQASYRKINGVVYLRGLLQPGATAAGNQIYQLPTGYRPVAAANEPTHQQIASGASGGALNFYGDGRIITNYGCTGYISLNNITFPAA